MNNSRFRGHAGRCKISHFATENHPQWILIAELGSVRDWTSSFEKRIFAIELRPVAAEVKGKAIRRFVIFDNHPDSLRLVLKSGGDVSSDNAASRQQKRTSIICGSILIAIVIAAMLWPLVW